MAKDYFTEEDWDKAMEQFFKEGGKVQQIPYGVASEEATTNFWGKPKKKTKDDDSSQSS